MEWLQHFWETLTLGKIVFGVLVLIVSLIISYGAIMLVIIKLPANYFSPEYSLALWSNKPFWVRWSAIIFKNIIGLLLVLAGIVMIVGPGPGLLTILLGLIMLDIPGKRPLEAKIIQRPPVLAAVNNLRARYNKSPLVMD